MSWLLAALLPVAALASHAEYRTADGGYRTVDEGAGDVVYAKEAHFLP